MVSDSMIELIEVGKQSRAKSEKALQEERAHEQGLLDKQLQASAEETKRIREAEEVSKEKDRQNRIEVERVKALGRASDKDSDQFGIEQINKAADLALKYSFGDLLKLNALEPYVFVGAGNSHVGTYNTEESPAVQVSQKNIFTFNAGIGTNYWFSSSWAVNLNGTAKWASASGNANHLQASIGAVYSLN